MLERLGQAYDASIGKGYYLLVTRPLERKFNREFVGTQPYDRRRAELGPVTRIDGKLLHANKMQGLPRNPADYVQVPKQEEHLDHILERADVIINGSRPWDPQVLNPNTYRSIFRDGVLGAGETYMRGEWDCEDLSGLVTRVTGADLEGQLSGNILGTVSLAANAVFERLRTVIDRNDPARRLAAEHYDYGNEFFESFLGPTMVYSCAMWGEAGWGEAQTLEEAQIRKLDILARKLGLKPGMRVLDIGGGWGSFAIYAASEYGVNVVATSISEEQIRFAEERRLQLPKEVADRIEFRIQDYRNTNDGPYDRIVNIGFLEHVKRKNYSVLFRSIQKNLSPDGIAVVHTITTDRPKKTTSDAWVTRHIFPGSEIPNTHDLDAPLGESSAWKLRLRHKQNYGPNYDRTCMEWFRRFDEHYEEFGLSELEYRKWKFYFLGSAGAFRSGKLRLEQAIYIPDAAGEDALNVVEYYQHPEEPINTSFRFED